MALNEAALERAADKLDKIGRHHGWWSETIPKWRDLDPIGKEEFLSLVDEIISAYQST